jgi:hypothetical protein
LRPVLVADNFSERKISKAEEEILRLIKGGPLDSKDVILCRYVVAVCIFRLAQERKEDTGNLWKEVSKIKSEMIPSGFNTEHLIALNRAFLDKRTPQLEEILDTLKKFIN